MVIALPDNQIVKKDLAWDLVCEGGAFIGRGRLLGVLQYFGAAQRLTQLLFYLYDLVMRAIIF